MRKGTAIDWILFGATIPLTLAGLSVLASFGGDERFFSRQIIWLCISVVAFFAASFVDWRFSRRTRFAFGAYLASVLLLSIVAISGATIKGAQSWFDFGAFSFQPVEFAKLALIILLAKYFSRRHIEIAHIRHIAVSGAYALFLFGLLLIQPDFGSAVIVFLVWLGMVSLSGISKKHIAFVFTLGALSFAGLWFFVFSDYQKARVINFIHPLADARGSGYNALQSMIAVGSGEAFGKGVGYGTQSRLKFLPEYQTDFSFAAFAEEWGFAGALALFALYGVVMWRLLVAAYAGATNFETLFALGVAVFFTAHFLVNIGMNIGLLPVTGVTLPFLSYGGSHLLMEFLSLGMVMGLRRHARSAQKESVKSEFVGVV
ncbi:MAG: rod shape-determining protein RodA [bacterium]|nr:rod shape-determining protein RodA [bacterium]